MITLKRVMITALACCFAVAAAPSAMADAPGNVDELVEMLASGDGGARLSARNHAANFGPEAVEPLAALFDDEDRNTYLAAKWSLRSIVHESARPREDEAEHEAARRAMAQALEDLLDTEPSDRVLREALYLLGLCGGGENVPAIAAWLGDPETVDHASAALVRIPGDAALGALLDALNAAEGDAAVALIHAIAQKEEAAARERLEALADSDDEMLAEAAAKALSIRKLRVDYEG